MAPPTQLTETTLCPDICKHVADEFMDSVTCYGSH